ncbi:Protein of unknown function [Raineyella antarctica]|uniref:DUF3099 domain-containing protein n=1 Tax=Raineyella antarctica TaxID=1577474 RepID=A0A1G6H9M2_9ACTN|nr:Protein of unknown function [Raineyella antarctica]
MSAEEDLSRRQTKYLALMSLRVICFVAAIFLHGAWRWVAVGGAAFLPAIAVVIANAIDLRAKKGGEVPQVTQPASDQAMIEGSTTPEPPIIIPGEAEPDELRPGPDDPRDRRRADPGSAADR